MHSFLLKVRLCTILSYDRIRSKTIRKRETPCLNRLLFIRTHLKKISSRSFISFSACQVKRKRKWIVSVMVLTFILIAQNRFFKIHPASCHWTQPQEFDDMRRTTLSIKRRNVFTKHVPVVESDDFVNVLNIISCGKSFRMKSLI